MDSNAINQHSNVQLSHLPIIEQKSSFNSSMKGHPQSRVTSGTHTKYLGSVGFQSPLDSRNPHNIMLSVKGNQKLISPFSQANLHNGKNKKTVFNKQKNQVSVANAHRFTESFDEMKSGSNEHVTSNRMLNSPSFNSGIMISDQSRLNLSTHDEHQLINAASKAHLVIWRLNPANDLR